MKMKTYGFEDFFAEARAKGMTPERLLADWKRLRPQDFAIQAEQHKSVADELIRLRSIEHHAWHLLNDSCDEGELITINSQISKTDLDALHELLPGDHPEMDRPLPTAPAVQEGWKLVPIEPTQDMVNTGHWPCAHNKEIWKNMIIAAPKPDQHHE